MKFFTTVMPRATFRPIVWFSLFNLLCDASTASWLIISHSAINFLNATLEFLCDAEESYSSKVKFRSLVIPCFYSLYSADLVNSGHNNVKKRTVVVWTNQLSIYVKKKCISSNMYLEKVGESACPNLLRRPQVNW